MKLLYITAGIFLFSVASLHSQMKFSTKTGSIHFEASVPSFEEVRASNLNVSAILNLETGEFAALALIKGFRFKLALMEEHFNENYMESDIYPKAVFKGIFEGLNKNSLSETKASYIINGSLSMHGETKMLSLPVFITKKNEQLFISGTFFLNPSDFNIKIPAVVNNKIAKEVKVSVEFDLSK